MKNTILIFVLAIFTLASCTDSSDDSGQYDCLGLSPQELVSVGELHNEYVTQVYEGFDFTNCNYVCSEEVVAAFSEIEIDLSAVNKTKAELIEEGQQVYQDMLAIEFDLTNWEDHPFSESAYVHLSTIMQEMDVMESYLPFQAKMNNLQSVVNADESLTCFDVELLIGTIEIAKNSAYLWAPNGLNYFGKAQKGNTRGPKWSWRSAAKADVATSATYFTAMGGGLALGLITPGSNVAILGMWGLTSAIGSALGGLG